MKKRKILTMLFVMTLFIAISASATSKKVKKEIYEWRIYSLTNDGAILDRFFEESLIPAYNRKGIKAGAFKLHEPGNKDFRYYLFVYPDMETYHKVKQEIWKDKIFRQSAQSFFDVTAVNPVYSNFESYLCEAFDKMPELQNPGKERSILEIRIYQSPNEEANQRKIKMFNIDEIAVFDKVGIRSVCYGEVLAGPVMPSLVYLTWYKDDATRLKAWDAFRKDPDWERIKNLPEYANTATNNRKHVVVPLPYSQI